MKQQLWDSAKQLYEIYLDSHKTATKLWSELDWDEQKSWYAVARYVEDNIEDIT
jgi:hypothetical protein